MIDPRPAILESRFQSVRRVLVYAGGKGGVGKSSCAVVSALLLARRGYRVGLLDFDFHGATDHILLGVKPDFPEEDRGVLPLPVQFGLKFMSIVLFAGEDGVPLRGGDLSNAFLELSAITRWGTLDFLVIDMPPGMGDEVLDCIKFIPRLEMVLVSGPARLTRVVVRRFAAFLLKEGIPIPAELVNYCTPLDPRPDYGVIPVDLDGGMRVQAYPLAYDPGFEASIGNPESMVTGGLALSLDEALSRLV